MGSVLANSPTACLGFADSFGYAGRNPVGILGRRKSSPALRELDLLRREAVEVIEEGVELLVGGGDDVWERGPLMISRCSNWR